MRVGYSQIKRINNRAAANMLIYTNRMNDSVASTTKNGNSKREVGKGSTNNPNLNINNYFRLESSNNLYPREPNLLGSKMSLGTLNNSAIKSTKHAVAKSNTQRRKSSMS
jgi:hypothetical protein